MKYLLFVIHVTLFCFGINAQKHQIDTLTQVRLTELFSEAELESILKDHDKLQKFDYIFSKSFEVKEGQEYTLDKYLSIDVTKYNHLRTDEQVIEVYDEESELILLLDSELEAKTKLPASFFVKEIPVAPTERLRPN